MLNRVMLNKELNSCDLMIGDWCLTDINSWIDDEYNPKCGVKDSTAAHARGLSLTEQRLRTMYATFSASRKACAHTAP